MFPGPPKPERGYKKRNDGTQNRNEGTKKRTTDPKNRNEGTFVKTTLSQDCPLVSLDHLLTNRIKIRDVCCSNTSHKAEVERAPLAPGLRIQSHTEIHCQSTARSGR